MRVSAYPPRGGFRLTEDPDGRRGTRAAWLAAGWLVLVPLWRFLPGG